MPSSNTSSRSPRAIEEVVVDVAVVEAEEEPRKVSISRVVGDHPFLPLSQVLTWKVLSRPLLVQCKCCLIRDHGFFLFFVS